MAKNYVIEGPFCGARIALLAAIIRHPKAVFIAIPLGCFQYFSSYYKSLCFHIATTRLMKTHGNENLTLETITKLEVALE